MTSSEGSSSPPVLHVLVVGFHHKKGCQVEYAHPPLLAPDGDPHSPELPSQWKHLPSLALPDGSHNFLEDTAYFHLPALDNPRKTVFGISCYRQIAADQLVKRTADITRGSVQKSVCVLSRLPLYGQIQVKMSLITEAYFREGDFSRLDLIRQTYDNLNACLTDDLLHTQQLYVGLSARQFVQRFRQRSLALFKLMLLERKVLFYQSPVRDLTGYFLTLLSLHPGMLEDGLDEAARMVPLDTPPSASPCQEEPEENKGGELEEGNDLSDEEDDRSVSSSIIDATAEKVSGLKGKISGYFSSFNKDETTKEHVEAAEEVEETSMTPAPSFNAISATVARDFGLPLEIFTGGNLCHPYLSLSYLDMLSQPSVQGYLIGATNVLFKQKRGVAEVIIDIDADRMDVSDPELRRALALTTEDLRFVDNIVKHVGGGDDEGHEEAGAAPDVFLDGVGWEGGDEWVRAQFRFYLICLLRSSLLESSSCALFNTAFMSSWRTTSNYRRWRHLLASDECVRMAVENLPAGHPFAGGGTLLSVSDVKLHFSNTMSNSEGGKRVSQAVATTGKALSSAARGAFSSLLTSFNRPPNQQHQHQQPQTEQAEEAIAES